MNTPRNHRKLRLVVILSSLALPLPPLGAEPFLLVAPFPLVAEEGAPAADRATVFARKIGREHRLLHEAYRNDNWEIFVRDSDGGNARNLTNTPDVHEMYPQASPDGSKICFVADEIVNGKKARSVYTMNRDGKARTLVARSARQPCWSPDSGTIAYLKSEFPVFNVTDFATKGLHFFDVEKNKHREHPNAELHHLYNITWSRDGRWIVSTVHGGGPRYFTLDAEFDRWFMGLLEEGDLDKVCREATIERMNEAGGGGTSELLAWMVAMAAAGGTSARSIFYVDSSEMRCGIGGTVWDTLQ